MTTCSTKTREDHRKETRSLLLITSLTSLLNIKKPTFIFRWIHPYGRRAPPSASQALILPTLVKLGLLHLKSVCSGRLVEEVENKMRNRLNEIYFGKTKNAVNRLRSVLTLAEVKEMKERERRFCCFTPRVLPYHMRGSLRNWDPL